MSDVTRKTVPKDAVPQRWVHVQQSAADNEEQRGRCLSLNEECYDAEAGLPVVARRQCTLVRCRWATCAHAHTEFKLDARLNWPPAQLRQWLRDAAKGRRPPTEQQSSGRAVAEQWMVW